MIENPAAKAEDLLVQGYAREAIAIIQNACASNNSDALLLQAMWKLSGSLLPRDLPGARALLRQATVLGNTEAALIEVALTGNGSGASADWERARALLEIAAGKDQAAAEQSAMLRQMALTPDGAPAVVPDIRQIAERPNIWLAARLFTPEECHHVAQTIVDVLAPATVIDPQTGRNVANAVRTSDGAVIGPTRETLVVQALNRRLAAVTCTDRRQGEALSVLRYRPGQQFWPHVDALPATRNQRIRTVLIYLNEGFKGGSTFFVGNQFRVTPRTGDAIIFDNVRSDGCIDPTTQHAGEPVTEGIKWLATRWIRQRPFDVWTGPENA